MKIKTSELTGAALDWAVAECEGPRVNAHGNEVNDFIQYSRDWAQGGPIIERGKIELTLGAYWWRANVEYTNDDTLTPHKSEEEGPTPLIAAMRCYVASKMGDEVEVPDELH